MQYYIQIDTNNNVTGYSSCKMADTDILIENIEELDNRFLSSPFYFRYNSTAKTFDYVEDLEKAYTTKKPTAQEILATQIAQIKMQSIQKNNILNSVVKAQATSRINSMNKNKVINMLILDQAKIRIKNMQEQAKGDK